MSSWWHVAVRVLCRYLTAPSIGLQCEIVAYPVHTQATHFVMELWQSHQRSAIICDVGTLSQSLGASARLCILHRGSYMNARVLLNLLNEVGKRDKMRGLPSNLSLFRNEFNKFNNTRARMLDSIYHMTNTLKSHFWRKNVIILSLCNVVMDVITFPVNR